jgi:Astacin (Peptidase family M12A)
MEDCKLCTEMPSPDFVRSVSAAIGETPDNVGGQFLRQINGDAALKAALRDLENSIVAPSIAIVIAKKWRAASTLTIGFVGNPDPIVKERIIDKAKLWLPHINLTFDFVENGPAKIRIATTWGLGSWSYIGTDALLIEEPQPTMNFGWLRPDTSDEEYERVVVHEFGHALGAIHEHQHPDAGIPWDTDKVYAYYADTNGWNQDEVDNNIFAKYDHSQLNSSEYDPASIMHYAVPNALTMGDWEVPWNTSLSDLDKAFMEKLYA